MKRTLAFLLASVAFAQLRVDFSTSAIAGSGDTLYAISTSSLFRTSDLGANWTAVYPTAAPGRQQDVLAVAINPLDPDTVYAGTGMADGGVWKSTDRGATWAKANTGLPATGAVEGLFTVENQPTTLYLKSGASLYKTVNAGASWVLQSAFPATGSVFTINTRTPNLMYFVRPALGESTIATIYRSSNEGASWDIAGTILVKPVGDPGTPNSVGAIVSSPTDPDVVFLSTRGPLGNSPYTAIHKSTNRGASFAVSRASGNAQRMIADSSGNIFWTSVEASSGTSRLEKSSNGGATWEVKTFGTGISGQPQLSVDLQRPGHMFAALGSGVYRSTDAGETWTRLSGNVKGTLVVPNGPYVLQGAPGSRFTQNATVRFVENSAWAAPFTAAVENGSWLTLSASSGTTPATFSLNASTTGLAKGAYTATIRISSPGFATGDVLVPVNLTLTDVPVPPRSYRISTVAGGGGSPPVGAAPTQALLSQPSGGAFDPSGNMVISDAGLNRVFRVRNGVLELIAGSGVRGFAGDDGPATSAQLASPVWTAFGSSGDVYISDTSNFRVRRVDPQGVISTVSTATRFSLGGLLVDSTGNLFSASAGEIRMRTPSGTDTRFVAGPSTPGQLIRDANGDFYLTDATLHQILRLSGGSWTVLAGVGGPGFSGDGLPAVNSPLNTPRGLAIDPDGNIFVADSTNHRIRMIDRTGTIFTIAGTGVQGFGGDGGPAADASLSNPHALTLDSSGNLYFGDGGRVRKLTLLRPSIKPNGVANAASYTADASPGSLVAIFGDDLANGTDAAKSAPWPTILAGATVTLNGRLMPLYYVSPTQVNAMVPYETPLGPATLVVSVGGVASAAYTVNISQASPGIIGFGDNRAVAVNEDGSLNTAANPARPGSTVVIYMIGIGGTDIPVATGAAAPLDRLVRPAGPSTVTLGSQTVTPAFLGLTPGSVALAQLNLKIDESLANGDYAVKVTIEGKESNAPAISVRR